jgi:hypothetical protein
LSQKHVLKGYIGKVLFKVVKFITHDSQMDLTVGIARKVFANTTIQPEQQLGFWNAHKQFIHRTLITKRNNITMTLKEACMSKVYVLLLDCIAKKIIY